MAVRLRMLAGAIVGALALTLIAVLPQTSQGAQSLTIAGPVTAVGDGWVTVQTAGRRTGVINALTASANKVTSQDYPYVWGGGHGEAGVASTGERGGPGYNGKTHGYDCSGAVAAVLSGAGLWAPGASVPADNGVISELLAEHLIARGVGKAPTEVTLYDEPGVHIFMNINGRFFGTSDGSGGGDGRGGAGWLSDGAFDASDPHFKKYHFLPSVLKQSTSYGNNFTFQLSDLLTNTDNVVLGDRISVGYSPQSTGAMLANTVTFTSGHTTVGQVTAITAAGLQVTTASGRVVSFVTQNADFLLVDLLVGDTVTVVSTPGKNGANPTAHIVTVTAQPVVTTPTGTTTTGTTTTGTTTLPTTTTTTSTDATPTTTTTAAPTPSGGPSTATGWSGPGGGRYGFRSAALRAAAG